MEAHAGARTGALDGGLRRTRARARARARTESEAREWMCVRVRGARVRLCVPAWRGVAWRGVECSGAGGGSGPINIRGMKGRKFVACRVQLCRAPRSAVSERSGRTPPSPPSQLGRRRGRWAFSVAAPLGGGGHALLHRLVRDTSSNAARQSRRLRYLTRLRLSSSKIGEMHAESCASRPWWHGIGASCVRSVGRVTDDTDGGIMSQRRPPDGSACHQQAIYR